MAGQSKTDTPRLHGSMVALVTPFRDGSVDYAALNRLVDLQLEARTHALVPCGTTGESPTLTAEEHDRVIETVIARCDGSCPVVAGTGSNSTAETIRRTRQAAAAGADAALIVAPYYNRPTQEGLYRHYAAVAEASDIPIILYNVPKRTGVSIAEDTVIRLRRDFAQVVALKHATGSLDGVDRMLRGCDIDLLSGDDALTWPLMAMGAVGVISVVANIDPRGMRRLVEAARAGDAVVAADAHRRVSAMADGLSRFGPNPIPIKTALALKGLCAEEFRLPLCPMNEPAKQQLADLLRSHELL